ncbi:mucin-5B-like isoform X1 [Branchiostoma floridae]|uniref:Mucin-5B-like isoform X1 n=2 Tax=Branchiostoma floridae TaxID=7739 RepID=A0A9J7LJH5_BRAFL|nr:mucin-5B-like isoform X1 [Branchiostoma floridae]
MRAGVSPFSWRTADLCPMDCPANSHFSTCTSACPATCVNPSAPDNCNLPCEEGCECDEGYVLSGQECVLQTNCGCIDDEGFYHALGDVWQDDGEMCECLAEDTIVCEGLTRTDLCARPARGICRACGDPHVTMFDGKRHHFQGPCRYTFAKDCGNPSDFTVEVQHVPVPRRPVVSVVREVFVIAHGYEIGIHQGNDVTVNGVLYSVPFTLAMDKIDVRYRGIWVHVRLVEYCVDIFYNGRHCVKVTVTPYYWGRMCGLCGNYNGVMSDDLMMSDLETIALNWNDFGDSWLVEDEDDERCGGHPPPPTCPPGLLTAVSANDMCGLITDTDGPFAGCHGCVDPLDFFNDCVFDMCAQDGEIEGLCENLEAYADACEDDGVAITWRTSTRCPLPCPPNSHYNPCTSICPPTCQHPLPDLACVGCVECCECDPGYVMSGPHCVPLEECGCTDPDTGRYYELGETWVEDGQRCICRKNNKIICKGCSFDIVFILDRSSSIGPYGMYIAEKYIAHIIKCLYGLDVYVGYIVFDCISTWLISLGLYNVDTSGLIPKIKAAEFTGGESRTGHAIYHMMCTANYRNGIPSAAVVLTDGFAYKEYPSNLYEIQSDLARAMGIELYAVAVGRDPLFNFNGLANIAGGSDRVFDRYSCCALAIRLMEDLCVACDVSSDLFFVLDGSGSVGPDNFETVKQFVVNVVSAFTISLTDTRVGVVQYSHFNTLACNLGDHPDEASFVTAINTMQHQDGGTTTGDAMDFARQEANWRDAPTPRIMIVLTDGKSGDDVVAAAQALAADGVTVYAIGVANFDTAELLEITNGNQDRVIELKDYTALTASINSIVKALCIDNNPCEKAVDPGPCRAYFPRWYFNSQTGQCEQFIYGGCLGNDNNFVTAQECQNTCGPTDPCEQAMDPGPCKAAFPRWYFNSQTGQCEQFIYGGCLGNDNNFVTEQECQTTCGPTDPCEQAMDPGPCEAIFPRWYFNSQTGQCEQFIYGGCDGNGNNFVTVEECQDTCGVTTVG